MDSGVRKGCIMSPWVFNVYIDERGENGYEEEGREWILPGLLYADDLVLCGELEDLRAMVGCFVEVCRKDLKVNAGKSRVMVLGGEEGLE